MRIVGRGHVALRATHDKTLELTHDTTLTERATCVVATGCTLPRQPMAGPIRVTVSAGAHTFYLDARAVSSWHPGDSLVIRRSSARTPNTFAVDATATAADLPRELAASLADPQTQVNVQIDRRPSPPTLVIASTHLSAPRMAAEVTAADELVDASDRKAPRPPQVIFGEVASRPTDFSGRVLVRTEALLPRIRGYPAGMRVETAGLHPAASAVAAAPWPGPVTFSDELGRVPARHLLVVRTTDPAALTVRAATVRGTTHAAVAADGLDPFVHDLRDPLPRLPEVVWCCLAPASESSALEPPVRAAVQALLDDGVATKTVAKALAALTRQPQRHAYDVVLGLRAGHRPT